HQRVSGKGLQPKTPALRARLLAARRVRARPARTNPQGGRCAATSLMSFRRHGEIYRSDEKAARSLPGRPPHCTSRPPQPHRLDEFPAGYSLAGCSPALPASASPAGAHLAGRRLRCTINFQRTANSVLTVCLSPGDNPSHRLCSANSTTDCYFVCFPAVNNSRPTKVFVGQFNCFLEPRCKP